MAVDDNTSYELTGAQVKDLAQKIRNKADDNTFVGSSSGAVGSKGLVPAPAAGDQVKFLKGNGSWGTPSSGGNEATYIATDLLQMKYTQAASYAQSLGVINIMQSLSFPNQDFVFLTEDGTQVVPVEEICSKFGQGYTIKIKGMFQNFGGMNVTVGSEKVNGSIISADPYSFTNYPMVMSFMHENATSLGYGGTFVIRLQQTATGSDSKKYGVYTKL